MCLSLKYCHYAAVVYFIIIRAASRVKRAFEHVQNTQIQIILRMRKVSSGHLRSIETVVSNVSVQGRPWSDCADAQADQGLRWPHMPKDTFSYGAAHNVITHQLLC